MTQLSGPDPAVAQHAGWDAPPPRKGFFTDTSICIGCKACEVACKEWNAIPADGFDLLGSSYDNTGALGASTWRHVAFIEQPGASSADPLRWLMSSDVCKHCTHAGCLDVCPTGSLFRSEYGTVVVQDDICNGCGYCVPACPFGVIERRTGEAGTKNAGTKNAGIKNVGIKNVGIAQKCTLCYDRLDAGASPACATACPTQSIQYGDLDELRERARLRVDALQAAGEASAQLYLDDPDDGIGGGGSIFLLLDRPEVYGLPPDPVVATRDLPAMWRTAATAAVGLLAAAVTVFAGRQR